VDLEDIEETVVEDKKPKAKPKFCEVDLKRRYGEELIDFRDLSNPDYFPVLETNIRNHDRNSYTGFYYLLHLNEERFTSEDELE
jgi:hypothetical protein